MTFNERIWIWDSTKGKITSENTGSAGKDDERLKMIVQYLKERKKSQREKTLGPSFGPFSALAI